MKQVLWVSRHEMTPQQLADLERALGDSVELRPWPDTVRFAGELAAPLKTADAVAAVLPVDLLAELLDIAGQKPVLLASSVREVTGRTILLPDGRRENEVRFVHCGWRQLLCLTFKARPV